MKSIEVFTWIWIGIAVLTFMYLLYVKTAPYGRHSSTNWGPMIDNKLGWFIMELPALVLFFVFFFKPGFSHSKAVWFFAFCWFIHYFNRVVIFPLRIKTNGKKMPLIIVFSAILFNTINTYLIGSYLGNFSAEYLNTWFYSPQFVVGFILFASGFLVNQISDYKLINLRKPGESDYKIPNGFLFNYVSCPNLFGEIVEWFGFAIMLWCLPGWAFFIWTFANLVPRAIAHHKWYLTKFNDYSKKRKAVFPFLW